MCRYGCREFYQILSYWLKGIYLSCAFSTQLLPPWITQLCPVPRGKSCQLQHQYKPLICLCISQDPELPLHPFLRKSQISRLILWLRSILLFLSCPPSGLLESAIYLPDGHIFWEILGPTCGGLLLLRKSNLILFEHTSRLLRNLYQRQLWLEDLRRYLRLWWQNKTLREF